jgi:hypothetical protein
VRLLGLLIVIGVIGTSAGMSGASAETIEKTVKANTRTAVDGIFTYVVQTCEQSAIPDAHVAEAPKNGTVVVQMHQIKADRATNCAGRTLSGPIFVYTPAKGFKGEDGFTIEFPFAQAESRAPTMMSKTYRLTVQ